jgi:hypothetical protein
VEQRECVIAPARHIGMASSASQIAAIFLWDVSVPTTFSSDDGWCAVAVL